MNHIIKIKSKKNFHTTNYENTRYFHRRERRIKQCKGFSLVEMLVVIAIISILAMMVIPSMKQNIQDSKMKELSGEFMVALSLAQSESIKRAAQVGIVPLNNDWSTGWNVFSDPNLNGLQDVGEELIQTYALPSNNLSLTSKNTVFESFISFLPSGAIKGASGNSGGFRICTSDNNIKTARNITIQASGNVFVEKGALSCP